MTNYRPQYPDLVSRLNRRRQELGLSCATLADRSGLSLRTIQRLLSGEESDPGFATVMAVAESLGMSLHFQTVDIAVMRRQQAEAKARQLMAMVQATSALEAQAVPAETIAMLEEQTIVELLAGSPRKLWAN